MIAILQDYFSAMRAELRLWLGVFSVLCVTLPRAAWLRVRERAGLALAERAIRILPKSCELREGLLRGLQEQREYIRYEAWTEIAGARPLPFGRWAEQKSWIDTKFRMRVVV